MKVRGIRGAITVEENTAVAIVSATGELLNKIVESNRIKKEDIASIFFSVTDDLDAEFPAVAAREAGMSDVPLLCCREAAVRGSLAKCVRILLHMNTDKEQNEMTHIYLKGARILRPDLDNENKG